MELHHPPAHQSQCIDYLLTIPKWRRVAAMIAAVAVTLAGLFATPVASTARFPALQRHVGTSVVRYIKSTDLEEMIRANATLRCALRENDPLCASHSGYDFHHVLARRSDNPDLTRIIDDLIDPFHAILCDHLLACSTICQFLSVRFFLPPCCCREPWYPVRRIARAFNSTGVTTAFCARFPENPPPG